MSFDTITIIALSALLLFMAIGAPIFISLGFAGAIGIYLVSGTKGLFQIPASITSQLYSFLLVAIPLYVLMGELIFVSGIGRDIYNAFSKWLNRIPGGLAIATIYSCALFGAMCGVSIAGVAAIGTMAIPEMLKRGYDRKLAAGAVAAPGALAVLIPPSISFIIYGSLSGESVAKLFIGGIVPGLVLATMMAGYVLLAVLRNPSLAPREFTEVSLKEKLASLKRLWVVILLIIFVLGSIYTGIATPTEAASIGVAGALAVTIIYKTLTWKKLLTVLSNSARISASLLIILACAFTFSQFLNLVRLPERIAKWATSVQVPGIVVILIFMGVLILLGCIIDGASLIIVTTPIMLPAVKALGFDPLWFGILMVLNVEIAVITPPVGLNLYTLKSIAEDLHINEIIRGTAPYIIVEILCLLLFVFWPSLALWLPSTMR
ncbi:MAG: TRAP transporter large permease subunit [Synergistetes bacterium]|nr:TRAP transporter large permease subunit [Synergistota bacterium]MDW8192341.1 TRAP transporter large permease subunit [Synergistota bacterium]